MPDRQWNQRKRDSKVESNRSQTGCVKTTFILVGAAVAILGLILVIGDVKCAYDVEDWWMPLYPDGETVDVQYDFIRPRAWGNTTWSMTTADDVETVKQFYRDTRLFTLNNKTRGIAWGESKVGPLESAIDAARVRYESILQELDADTTPEEEAEIEGARAWLNTLEAQLDDGKRSLVILLSVCGI